MVFIWILFALLCLYTFRLQCRNRNMPPGPFVIHILGNSLAIWLRKPTLNLREIRPFEYFDKVSKTFGDLFMYSVFGKDFVVITSYKLLKEVSQMEEYSAKFAHKDFTYARNFGKELGILFVSIPEIWKEMRKFTVRTLRDFGLGKSYTTHSVVREEIKETVESLTIKMEADQGIVQFRNFFSFPVFNVLWSMIAGTRLEHDDPRLVQLLDRTFEFTKSRPFAHPTEFITPLASKLLPGLFKGNSRIAIYDQINEFAQQVVKERKNIGVYKTDPQNYIDVFLRKIDEKAKGYSVYTDEQLYSMIADVVVTGTSTMNATLNYAILFLTLYPKIQARCQDELDSLLVMHDMLPTVDELEKLHFFQAFLLETHRVANVVLQPIPRITPKTWNLKGYTIPKGTFVLSNHFSVNTDSNMWENANEFKRERFINADGKFVRDPRVVLFGFGKRKCIGISLVDSIVPLFICALLQKFSFSVVEGTELPTAEPETGLISNKLFRLKSSQGCEVSFVKTKILNKILNPYQKYFRKKIIHMIILNWKHM